MNPKTSPLLFKNGGTGAPTQIHMILLLGMSIILTFLCIPFALVLILRGKFKDAFALLRVGPELSAHWRRSLARPARHSGSSDDAN